MLKTDLQTFINKNFQRFINKIFQRLKACGDLNFFVFVVLWGKFAVTWKSYNSSLEWCDLSIET